MVGRCAKCKNAVSFIGAYTGTHFIECKFEIEIADNATSEQLLQWINHPETEPKREDYCKYHTGKPADGGITFDD